MFKPLTVVAAVTLFASGPVHASPCDALAVFFGNVVKASGAEIEPEAFKTQMAQIRGGKENCTVTMSRLTGVRSYTHEVGGLLSPLKDYLVDDARFAIEVIGSGEKIEMIEFDLKKVAVLRRRPTR